MLQRLLEAKDALQETVMDRDFKRWMTNIKKTTSKEEGRNVVETVVDESFWKSSEELTCLCEPIISLLRLVDGIAPFVRKVYWKLFQIDNGVEPSTVDNQKKIQLRSCINERWKMMHTELHSAGFVVDPEFRSFLQHENEKVVSSAIV